MRQSTSTQTRPPTGVLCPRDYQRAFAICLAVFAISFLTYSRTLPPNADEMMNYALTESLAKAGRLDVDQVATVGANPEEYGLGGHRYSKYGPIQAVLATPLYWLATRLPVGAVDTVLLENHLISALTIGLLYLLTRRLGYRPATALAVSLVAFFGTPVWVHAKRFFGEPTTMLWLVATVYWIVAARQTGRRRELALAGFAVAISVAAKYVNVVFLMPLLLVLACPAGADEAPALPGSSAWRGWLRSGARRAGWVALGAAPAALVLAAYNYVRFGSPLESGYARWEQFNTPIWEGVGGFLFSPGKSVFVYAPILLLLFLWLPAFWRRRAWLAGALLAMFVLHLGVYGTWWVWWGAWAWGPRFVVPLMPLAVLLLAEGFERAVDQRRRLELLAAGALAAIGVVFQALGVAVDHTVYMAKLLPLNPKPDTLTLYDLQRNPILAQLQFLDRQHLDFAWVLRSGPALLDLQPLLAALGCLFVGGAAAVWLWRARPSWRTLLGAFGAVIVVAGAVLFALNRYYRGDDPALRGIGARLGGASTSAAVIFLAPDSVVPYSNSQKSGLYSVGWQEQPEPLNPRLLSLLEPLARNHTEAWIVTQYPHGGQPNGIERWIARRGFEVEEVPAGQLRLLRYRLGANATSSPTTKIIGARLSLDKSTSAPMAELLTAEIEPGSAVPGELAQLTLVWRSPAGLPADYTVFVHLLDASGKLISQQDGPPGDGFRPTSGWVAGEKVPDHHAIPIPPGTDPATCKLSVGLYLPTTGARLAVVGGEDSIEIPLR